MLSISAPDTLHSMAAKGPTCMLLEEIKHPGWPVGYVFVEIPEKEMSMAVYCMTSVGNVQR